MAIEKALPVAPGMLYAVRAAGDHSGARVRSRAG